MNEAIDELERNVEMNIEIEYLLKLMDNIVNISSKMTEEEISQYSLDSLIKKILKKNKSVEILEKISDLLILIRDPRNFYDELLEFTDSQILILPTLMLIFQIQTYFEFEFENFYEKLLETLTLNNVESEGYLLFLLKCLDNKDIEIETVKLLLKSLSKYSIEVPSESSLRIVYCMLVIMRMHPITFKYVEELKELNILIYSFDSIKNVIERIYIEAKHPKKRPKIVFLQNFIFPSIKR